MIKQYVDVLKINLANIFTFCNLSAGITAIIMMAEKQFIIAAFFVLLGALFDRYDGRIARKFNSASDLGKELDSLADIITFGVAPSLIAFSSIVVELKIAGYFAAVIFIACGAFRLSRYNISNYSSDFTGLPITAAGSLLAVSIMIQVTSNYSHLITILEMIFLSYLMVSKIKFKKI